MISLRTALDTFRRSPLLSALSVTTIAFSLFAFGLFGLVALNIRTALRQAEERVEIRAFLVEGLPLPEVEAAASAIAALPEVQRTDVVTSDQALERARKELGEFKDVFESQFLPPSVDVRLKPGFRDPAHVRKVADRIRAVPSVEDARFGEEWITQLYRLRNIAAAAGLALGLAFAGVAVIIIGATIRMAVLARSREISIMRLVGATDGFIRRPFLIEGALKGLMGGLIALGLTWTATRAIEYYLHFQTTFFDRQMAAAGIAVGALIGLLGSAASVGRHLRSV